MGVVGILKREEARSCVVSRKTVRSENYYLGPQRSSGDFKAGRRMTTVYK